MIMKKHRIRSRFAAVMVFVFLMTMLPAEGMIIGGAEEASLTSPAVTGESGRTEENGSPAVENTEAAGQMPGSTENSIDSGETAEAALMSVQQEIALRTQLLNSKRFLDRPFVKMHRFTESGLIFIDYPVTRSDGIH